MFEVFFGIWQFLLVFGVGLGLTRWASISPPYGFRLAASFGFGMSAFSMGFLLLGTFGGLRPSLLFPVSMILTLPALWSIYSESAPLAKAVTRSLKSSPFAFALMMVLLFIYFLGACVPEREEDAIWYHLGVPIYYLYHGGFIQDDCGAVRTMLP